jgi:sporulation protein YlmC with PRC-barrel domain
LRNIPLTAVAIALSLGAPVAYGQTMNQPVRLLNVALTTQSGGLRASQIIGSTVYDMQNRNIGSVKDIVLDPNGRVTAVVVDVGAFLGVGGKYVAVGLNDIKTDNDRLTLNRTKEQLQSAQAYDLGSQK